MNKDRARPIAAFIDLAAQREHLGDSVEKAIAAVLKHGQYVLGPEVTELERKLAEFCGAKHCITCANGTDALLLVLMAEGIGPGDAVFVPDFTFVATAEVVVLAGATPVLVDVNPDSFNMDVASHVAAIGEAKRRGLKPRAVIPVDLYGQPADYPAISRVAKANDLIVLADAAQSFGASFDGEKVGTLGDYTATSFYPSKPLGGYGDGGAIFTDSDEKAELLISLRCHGKAPDQPESEFVGLNSRLDTIQAAILLQKLRVFPNEIAARQAVADRYAEGLGGLVPVPTLVNGATSVWAQYTILVERRDEFAKACREAGVPTAIHYLSAIHALPSYREFPKAPGLRQTDGLARRVISLPMHAYLAPETQDRIIETVQSVVRSLKAGVAAE
ncbi:MAG: DegT/DnrJ/EryC1/StrS family aminotransferase [Methyloceanibacter sp.]